MRTYLWALLLLAGCADDPNWRTATVVSVQMVRSSTDSRWYELRDSSHALCLIAPAVVDDSIHPGDAIRCTWRSHA